MDAIAWSVVRDVLLATGPAAVAAFAGYKAASIQLRVKREEMRSVHGFEARRLLYQHYMEERRLADEESSRTMREAGKILGQLAAAEEEPASHLAKELIRVANASNGLIPGNLASLRTSMEQHALAESSAYATLVKHIAESPARAPAETVEDAKVLIVRMTELVSCMTECEKLINQSLASKVLDPYIGSCEGVCQELPHGK